MMRDACFVFNQQKVCTVSVHDAMYSHTLTENQSCFLSIDSEF